MQDTAPRSVRLGDLNAAEAAKLLAGGPVLLLPLGSHESHGPFLPMGDYMAAELIAVRIAQAAWAKGQPCLVAPVLPFGGADYFGSVPGGIALRPATLVSVLSDMIGGLLRHGIDRLVIINGHGGNAQPIHEATLAVRRATGIVIPSFYLWKIARQLLDRMVGPQAAALRAGHGADPVASIAMHLFGLPGADAQALPAGEIAGLRITGFGTAGFEGPGSESPGSESPGSESPGFEGPGFEGIAIDMPLELDEIAPSGIAPAADPRVANAADGACLTARLTEIGAAFVCHHARQTDGKPIRYRPAGG